MKEENFNVISREKYQEILKQNPKITYEEIVKRFVMNKEEHKTNNGLINACVCSLSLSITLWNMGVGQNERRRIRENQRKN